MTAFPYNVTGLFPDKFCKTLVASGYFNDAAATLGLKQGDIITAVEATGGTETLSLIFVDAVSAGGVVTVLSSVQTLA